MPHPWRDCKDYPKITPLLLRNSSWPATGPWWRLNTWPRATELSCNLSCLLWTVCYLTHPVCTATFYHQVDLVRIHMWSGPSSPKGTNKLHEEVTQMPMGPHFCYTALSLPGCTYGLMGSSLWSADRGDDLGLVYRWFCVICRHYLKVSSCSITSPHPSRTSLKDTGEEKFSSGQNFGQCTWLFTLLGRRNGQTWNYIPIHGPWPVVWLDGREPGKNITGKLVTKKFGYVALWMGKRRENICVPCECSPESVLNREGF